jgi:hypothetical protein
VKSYAAFGIAWFVLGAAVASAQTVNTESLLNEMTDLAGLAEFPTPPFTCKQFSSYDRASKSPDDAKGWFANGDTGQFLRGEDHDGRRENVMADMEGPGAVVRIWSADPKGTIRIYLDESKSPAIECPMNDWLGGTHAGVPKPIAGEYSKGWSSYFPIAYAKHCKITSDQPGFYYHVNYRTYPKGTALKSFDSADLQGLSSRIRACAAILASPAEELSKRFEPAGCCHMGTNVGPGRAVSQTFPGPGAIAKLDFGFSSKPTPDALRKLVLRITFDGAATVEAPLGEFLGSGIGMCQFNSLPLSIGEQGIHCFWLMPFEKSAKIELSNSGPDEVQLGVFDVHTIPYKWTDRSMHFHAKWRADWQVPTRPMIDWNYLTASGQGQFVGVAFNIANPVRHWWGEGDEKIYVDDETFPSHFGTGTEDYYGYAWCWPAPFTHAYHAQPRCDGPGNYGITCVNRFHILDRIPFRKSFRFDMELWHWHDSCKVDMAVTAYWYARPGAMDKFPPIKPTDLRAPAIGPYTPEHVAGVIEGESLKIVEKAGTVEPQSIDGCSGDQHLWWRGGQKVGDRLVLAVPVGKAGRYRAKIRCLKAGDYGIMQLSMNDAPAGAPIDFYNSGVKLSEEIELGTFDLPAGEARLGVTVTGANEKALKAYMFGLDFVRLEALP